MKNHSLSFAAVISVALCANAMEARPRYTGVEAEAHGKAGVAVARGNEALFLNPAGLASQDSTSWNVHMAGVLGLNAVLLDYAQWAADNASALGDPELLMQRMEEVDTKWAPFSNNIVVEAGIGRAAFTVAADVEYSLSAVQGALTPVLGIGAASDVIVAGGYGRDVGRGYSVGGALQVTHMTRYDRKIIGFMDEDFYTVLDVMQDDNASSLDKVQAASEVALTSITLGATFGMAKKLPHGFLVGATLSDLPEAGAVSLGAGYEKRLPNLGPMVMDLRTALDWARIFAPDVRWYQQPRFGTVINGKVGKAQVGYIATGLHDGYPTFGVGLGYFVLLEYVYFVRELGDQPGQDPLSYHKLGMSLRF